MAVQQPEQPGAVDAGEGPHAIAAEQVVRSPAKRLGDRAERAVEEMLDIIDEAQPPFRRHVVGRTFRIDPGEALGPGARNVAVVFDNRGSLFLIIPPCRIASPIGTYGTIGIASLPGSTSMVDAIGAFGTNGIGHIRQATRNVGTFGTFGTIGDRISKYPCRWAVVRSVTFRAARVGRSCRKCPLADSANSADSFRRRGIRIPATC
jgi:hypothetical protein